MIIQTVKFRSRLSAADMERVMKERTPHFQALTGLVQKYYGIEKDTGELTGIYLWDSEESAAEFRKSELAQTISKDYQAEGPLRIELFELVSRLRD